MNLLYNTGIRLYTLAVKIAALRNPKAKKMISGRRNVNSCLKRLKRELDIEGFDIWVHTSSLGEFEQARPMIERIREEKPDKKMLLTFFSPSGYEVRKNYDKVDAVAYLPFDTPHRVKRFLNVVNPGMAIFVKYEFWGNYLQQLHKRNVPIISIDAIFRPGQRFFNKFGSMFRDMLRCFDHMFVQDERSRELLKGIGLENVTVTGDTRFDRVTDIMKQTVQFPAIEQWIAQEKKAGAKHVLIAGSSWQPDEECYANYLNGHPNLLAIVAPHEFNEIRLARLQNSFTGQSVLYSEVEKMGAVPAGTQVVIIDSFGKLSSLYRYGDLAIIGGGFGAGIHNINEAAVYGMPVLFGPKHEKFKEASDLIECGGAFEYDGEKKLWKTLDRLLSSKGSERRLSQAGKAAGKYIKDNLGATERIYQYLFNTH
ncbi:MAG: 3-deoxy-D-manno-octulosonic acid transferase [Bacteroidales bacterium]|nr:3-deoxy-D-manno-octulosonic acid transferase [Bacteroidales bacterium]